MLGQRYWVEDGKFGAAETGANTNSSLDERAKLCMGHVRLTTGNLGTEIKWQVLSPCNASLFATEIWLRGVVGRVVLRFFCAGWFEEFFETSLGAKRRVEEIIARSDRHIFHQTMIKEFALKRAPLSSLHNGCIAGHANSEDYAIECVYEDTSQKFHVEKVGPKSVIGRVYGPYLSSFACRSTGAYSETVSFAYGDVLTSGKPRYDHILSAMKMPDDEVYWVPYSRLLMPKNRPGKSPSVLVISEIGRVDIRPI
jgi:hypothetical protein